jgi:hypothetical protein
LIAVADSISQIYEYGGNSSVRPKAVPIDEAAHDVVAGGDVTSAWGRSVP